MVMTINLEQVNDCSEQTDIHCLTHQHSPGQPIFFRCAKSDIQDIAGHF